VLRGRVRWEITSYWPRSGCPLQTFEPSLDFSGHQKAPFGEEVVIILEGAVNSAAESERARRKKMCQIEMRARMAETQAKENANTVARIEEAIRVHILEKRVPLNKFHSQFSPTLYRVASQKRVPLLVRRARSARQGWSWERPLHPVRTGDWTFRQRYEGAVRSVQFCH
jgi:hypothetical protein